MDKEAFQFCNTSWWLGTPLEWLSSSDLATWHARPQLFKGLMRSRQICRGARAVHWGKWNRWFAFVRTAIGWLKNSAFRNRRIAAESFSGRNRSRNKQRWRKAEKNQFAFFFSFGVTRSLHHRLATFRLWICHFRSCLDGLPNEARKGLKPFEWVAPRGEKYHKME